MRCEVTLKVCKHTVKYRPWIGLRRNTQEAEAPAKGVGRATGARVRIPLSPFCLKITSEKNFKKVVDRQRDI